MPEGKKIKHFTVSDNKDSKKRKKTSSFPLENHEKKKGHRNNHLQIVAQLVKNHCSDSVLSN